MALTLAKMLGVGNDVSKSIGNGVSDSVGNDVGDDVGDGIELPLSASVYCCIVMMLELQPVCALMRQ